MTQSLEQIIEKDFDQRTQKLEQKLNEEHTAKIRRLEEELERVRREAQGNMLFHQTKVQQAKEQLLALARKLEPIVETLAQHIPREHIQPSLQNYDFDLDTNKDTAVLHCHIHEPNVLAHLSNILLDIPPQYTSTVRTPQYGLNNDKTHIQRITWCIDNEKNKSIQLALTLEHPIALGLTETLHFPTPTGGAKLMQCQAALPTYSPESVWTLVDDDHSAWMAQYIHHEKDYAQFAQRRLEHLQEQQRLQEYENAKAHIFQTFYPKGDALDHKSFSIYQAFSELPLSDDALKPFFDIPYTEGITSGIERIIDNALKTQKAFFANNPPIYIKTVLAFMQDMFRHPEPGLPLVQALRQARAVYEKGHNPEHPGL